MTRSVLRIIKVEFDNLKFVSAETSVPDLLTHCPVCGGGTSVERVRCGDCGTAVEGRFGLGWPGQLEAEQLAFVRVFLACRGKIKDVEQALGLSYPTVVARLDEVVEAIQSGRRPPPRVRPSPRPAAPPPADDRQRQQILDDLANGLIDVEEAARRLRES